MRYEFIIKNEIGNRSVTVVIRGDIDMAKAMFDTVSERVDELNYECE